MGRFLRNDFLTNSLTYKGTVYALEKLETKELQKEIAFEKRLTIFAFICIGCEGSVKRWIFSMVINEGVGEIIKMTAVIIRIETKHTATLPANK